MANRPIQPGTTGGSTSAKTGARRSPGRCELPAELARLGIDTVLITGTVTNVCCESTARDAANAGLRVVMVADGCAAINDRTHNATLHTIYRSFGDVRPLDEVVGLLGRGAAAV